MDVIFRILDLYAQGSEVETIAFILDLDVRHVISVIEDHSRKA